jgi:hypothetical protein
MANTKDYVFENETELSAVNSILASIGRSPVTSVQFKSPEVFIVYKIFTETIRDVLNEGWSFNTDYDYEFKPNKGKKIFIPLNCIALDVSGMSTINYPDTVIRDGKLYDRYNKTYEFEGPITCNVKWSLPFDTLPSVIQRYIESRAAVRAASQIMNSADLYKLLVQEETKHRGNCLEHECNQGDYSFFGTPKGVNYRSFKPYQALIR